MTTQPPTPEAVEAAMKIATSKTKQEWIDAAFEFAEIVPESKGSTGINLDALRILAAEVERLRARVAELEELIGLASTSFSMLEAYLGPQWFEAVSNMELVGPDKVHARAALDKKEGER